MNTVSLLCLQIERDLLPVAVVPPEFDLGAWTAAKAESLAETGAVPVVVPVAIWTAATAAH